MVPRGTRLALLGCASLLAACGSDAPSAPDVDAGGGVDADLPDVTSRPDVVDTGIDEQEGPIATVGGTVSGLTGSGLLLSNDATDTLAITQNGPFTFAMALDVGASFDVAVVDEPTNPQQSCTVSEGLGTVIPGGVTSVVVSCATATHTIGGSVSGLVGHGLVLEDNQADDLAVAQNGDFTFAMPVAFGAGYAVTVRTQPSGPAELCAVTGGSGTVGATDVTDVVVECRQTAFYVGGGVSGLAGTGLVLADNGGDPLPIAANGAFTFVTPLATGAAYDVTVTAQPSNVTQTCTVSSGMGNIAASNVTGVDVTCSTNAYAVGGTASGLTGSGLTLLDNGGDSLAVPADGPFAFHTKVASGAMYDVIVSSAPAGQTCTVANGSGTVVSADVATVNVSCGCAAGLTLCPGVGCVDLTSDPLNCGSCGTTCTSGICGASLSASMTTQPLLWSFNGSATYDGTVLSGVLTLAEASQAGTIIYAHPMVTDTFDVSFDFKMSGGTRADGIGFMIETNGATAVGHLGSGFAMTGLTGFGVELDIYNNQDCTDVNGNHAGIDLLTICDATTGAPNALATSGDLFSTVGDIGDGTWRTALVHLAGGQMSLSINGDAILSAVSLPGFVSGSSYYFGFGGGTGTDSSRQEIRNVTVSFPTPRCL